MASAFARTTDDQPSGAHVTTAECAGLRLRIEADDPADLDLVRRLVGDRPASGPIDVVLRLQADPPAVPDRPPDFQGPYGDHWQGAATHHFLHHWGLNARIDSDVAVLGGPVAGHRRWVAVRNSMLFVLAWCFYTRGRFVLHAGAIARDGRGVLVIGDSGTGKSTCCYSASRSGWQVLGDDMVVLDVSDPTLVVQGVPRVPSLPGDVAVLEGTPGDALPGDDRNRVELDDAELDRRPAPVAGVLTCAHGLDAAELGALGLSAAIEPLVSAFVLSSLDEPLQQWFPVAMRLARLPRGELRHAAVAEERVEGAARVLDEFARSIGPVEDDRTGHPRNRPDVTSSR